MQNDDTGAPSGRALCYSTHVLLLVMFIRNNLNFYRASGRGSLNLIYSIARLQHEDKIVAPHCCLVATPPNSADTSLSGTGDDRGRLRDDLKWSDPLFR